MLALRGLSLLAILLVGVVTLLPSATERDLQFLVQGRAFSRALGRELALLILGLTLLALIVAAWKSRIASRLHVSWPLFGVGLVYLASLAMLTSATIGVSVFGVVSGGLGSWERRISANLDISHALTYVALTILVALAWRRKIGIAWLVAGLLLYGYALELAQEMVPGREYNLRDFMANCVGIIVGFVAVLLFDLALSPGSSREAQAVPESRRRRGSGKRLSHSSSVWLKRNGLIAVLLGLLVLLSSAFIGAISEPKATEVGRQILGGLSTVYAFGFWLGALVMGAGGLMLYGARGSRSKRKTRRSLDDRIRQRQ